ncbi:hypothetical protein ACTFIY_001181 [Dictyostelium cf. discoideum]
MTLSSVIGKNKDFQSFNNTSQHQQQHSPNTNTITSGTNSNITTSTESISYKLDNLNDNHLQYYNISNLNKLKEYDNQSILFNNQIIDDIKNRLKLIYKFNNNNQNNKNNINIIDNNSVSNRIHICVGQHVDSTDDTLNHTLDNVNNPLNCSNSYGFTVGDVIKYYNDKLYVRVNQLPLGNVNLDIVLNGLKEQGIENFEQAFSLEYGFKESLEPGVLPNSIEDLEICDIKTPLVVGSIPSTVYNLTIYDGFNQSLEPDMWY